MLDSFARLARRGILPLALAASALAVPAHAQHPLDAFADATLERAVDLRDSLARRFNPVQLPLLVASVAEDSTLESTSAHRLYAAFTRWHFWTGARWDAEGRGTWTIDPRTVPIGRRLGGRTLSAHASLELVQLAGLARLAERTGNVFDALVWWNDHARLRDRLNTRLLDGARGVHCDLDSLGARRETVGISSAIALAAGLETAAWTARQSQWEIWTGRTVEDPGSVGGADRVAALERAEGALGWGADAGLRLLAPDVTAALVRTGVDRLQDVALSRTVSQALAGAGLPDGGGILQLRMGVWEPTLSLDALTPRPLERARLAVDVLDRMGVLSRARSARLPARVDSVLAHGDAAARDELVDELMQSLATWRAADSRRDRMLWAERRLERAALNGDDPAFRWQEVDASLWFERALDLLTEDVVAHHLRARPTSVWRAHIEPRVVGRGDPSRLVVEPTRPVPEDGQPLEVGALWTDGRTVLPARTIALEPSGSGWTGDLGSSPDANGLWRLVVEGLPQALRLPPAVSVVDPLQMRVIPVKRRGRTLHYRVEVTSQVRATIPARVDVTAPLSFDVLPAGSQDFVLDPGTKQVWDLEVRPDASDGPALHDLRFQLFDDARAVARVDEVAAVPLHWLRLGPLRALGDAPIDHVYDPDRSIDLAQRFRGVRRTVGWNRLPTSRIGTDGWIRLADADDPAGVHYVFTAFTTGSRESIVRIESNGPATARVNGTEVARTADWGGQDEAEVTFGAGTNFLLVKVENRAGGPCRVRVDVRDIDGRALRGVENTLERLLDQYAYLTRTRDADEEAERTLGRDSMRLVPFTFRADEAASVSVVGSFNGWSPTATRMIRRDDGAWQVKVRLQPGRFEYKFAIDGSRWIADPSNPEAVDDGFGGRNSVLVVE